jgi:hypothetical protein
LGESCPLYLHAVGQHEGTGELPGRDPAMEIGAGLIVRLAAPDDELVFLNRNIDFVAVESGNRKRDAKSFGFALGTRQFFDIVGGITIACRPGGLIEHTLKFIEPEHQWR